MEKTHRTFDLAIQDGYGQVRFIIPMSLEDEATIDARFHIAAYNFAERKLWAQNFETDGMEFWIENQGEADGPGEVVYCGNGWFE